MAARIKAVYENSIAAELGLEPGDELIAINGEEIHDVLDYRYLVNDELLTLTVKTRQGSVEEVELEKDAYDDLGLEFESGLMDKAQRCANACVFCFIDQLPKGMRESLYFKDDDTRLSFFQGNYVTLTNLSEAEIDRLIRMRVSPINISVHTMNPELRVKMLKNPRAAKLPGIMRRFADSGIVMNCQIVLCPGYNDGAELDYTLSELYALRRGIISVSVVPIGLTAHRRGLAEMQPVTAEKARELIDRIEEMQKMALKELGRGFVYAADELYLRAGLPIPDGDSYDGYPQIENGVGLIASLKDEFEAALRMAPRSVPVGKVTIVTGVAAAGLMKSFAELTMEKYPDFTVNVEAITNNFFGPQITVAGLLCGCDITEQLRGKALGDRVIISRDMLRDGTDVLLDDVTVPQLEAALAAPIVATNNDGFELLEAILGVEIQ
ncbi:MAG: DUF512 domain-containing protein [Oscillospiraceae bacterium]|nr:DUF512 domain-containing protein [Oscillospiraceae bacterium]